MAEFLEGSRLPDSWVDWLDDQPETGMGYWVVSLTLSDGRIFPDVALGAGHVLEIKGVEGVPFDTIQIVDMRVTHRRWAFRGRSLC